MTITIESQQEAQELASALLVYTKESLRRAGRSAPPYRGEEDPYYTEQRQLLRCLEEYCARNR